MRVVMYVRNDLTAEARALKEARSLVEAGHSVTVVGTLRPEHPRSMERDVVDGVGILRIRLPRWRRWWRWVRLPSRALQVARRRGSHGATESSRLDTLDWLAVWRFGTLAWARRASELAPRGDVHHGHDLTGLPAAARAAARQGGVLVYDSHELFLASGAVKGRPSWAVSYLDRLERRLAGRARAVVTVNDEVAGHLRARLAPRRIVVVHNCPPRVAAEPKPDSRTRLRAAVGLPETTPVAIYHGGLRPDRGIEELLLAFALPELAEVHLVVMGFGPLRTMVEARSRASPLAGRLHLLGPVPPQLVVDWISGADVAVMPIKRNPLSYALSTPNKLFESLAAGLPIVGPDSPGFRRVVLGDPSGPLGVLCDPDDPAAIAAAIRSLLDGPPAERSAMQARCRTAVLDRWNWEHEVRALLDLYAELDAEGIDGIAGTRMEGPE